MNQTEISVKIILDRWDASIKNLTSLLENLSDAALMKEIVPGKNRGIYLIGHLIAVHDDMLRLLDMGEKQYPELYEPFIKT
ncbi:MAG TPA: DinB family protein, partial [Bacteroidia bacterium]|nr:DinB family protein [Bacteroidia bacterium]